MGILCLAILQDILLYFLFKPYKPGTTDPVSLPYVSVLLAMRDEEENVDRCLNAIRNLDYPKGKIEILVGDDDSSDKTLELLRKHEMEDDRIQVISVREELGLARGKANVLAHLINKAAGSVFLITDADVECNPAWAKTMVGNIPEKVGVINGLTGVSGNIFQHYEWLQAQGMLHVLQRFIPITGIGNNMLVTREAYMATGGFETIAFSVTEDFALTRRVLEEGFSLSSRLCNKARGTTLARNDIGSLLSQRKRWMQGAVRMPVFIVFLLLVRALYYPAIISAFILFPKIAAVAFLVKTLFQAGLIRAVNRESGRKLMVFPLMMYELYAFLISWAEIIAYLIPGKVKWKGREFT
ncbi:glycosyltransferase [Fulvivirga sedimenti]|uniref:Glycosyltransferase n=1 Tax=Fulvivirga sedimenti TaxID=2879465 RepID=A0A9X1HU05_9BACT|nr:glycosyltransferase [Fulvivirga sedimenti]MCA6075217.1 glycosyltransferase [Fulvivirga sedimenti]MCA6076394.1 glycosyltransferase [Fulvivirga sedimenti]MCA6077522.1 glycosyltransferase [Fulvivirga sedimenti]